tara:strand:- start:1717 stop:2766 length:1050 start_codon:yes stop_codon:yes gene_type:complete
MFEVIKKRKIKVAVVGCGRISSNHFKSFKENKKDIELVAICDTNKKILSKFKKIYNVPAYKDIEEMLDTEDIDLVIICTPSGLHPEHVIRCAKKGINALTEKPMATRWLDGLEMVKACNDAKVKLFVVKQNRQNSTLKLLKKTITEKRFGKINMVNINVFWTRPQSYYDQAAWRGTWEFDGGALMNQASHYIDLLDWLIGPVEKVQCMLSTSLDIEVEDSGVINVKWRNGTIGSVNVTMLTYPQNLEGSITILGTEGSAKIGGVALNEIQEWKFKSKKKEDKDLKKISYETSSVYGLGHPLYYNNVINVMRGIAEPEVDGREGLKSLELIIAAYLSSRNGETISLPLEL